MAAKKYEFHDGQKGSALAIRVTPRASRNEIVEALGDGTVKVRLTAPPDEEQTNAALVAFLSEILGIPLTRIEIVAGSIGRDKLVSILEMDAETVHQKILAHLA